MEARKILLMADSPFLSTGYSNQARELGWRLAKDGYDVSYFAWNYMGRPLWHVDGDIVSEGRKPKNAYKVLSSSGRAAWGDDLLVYYLNTVKPELFIAVADSFMLQYMVTGSPHMPSGIDFAPTKTAFWFPSDGDPFVAGCDRVLKKFDYPIAMSRHAQKQVVDENGVQNAGYIPLGTDGKKFSPIKDKDALRAKWSQRLRADLRGKFVVGCVARNQGRKNVAALVEAFATFAQGKQDVFLLLHTDPNDPAGQGVSMMELLMKRGIGFKAGFTGLQWFAGFNEEEMRELYNLMDVHALPTTGEGFGIPLVEAAACGVPSIATDYTTTKEIITDHQAGYAVPFATFVVGSYNVKRAFLDEKVFAEYLQKAYSEWKGKTGALEKMGENGRKAFEAEYDLDRVVYPQWRKLVEGILK